MLTIIIPNSILYDYNSIIPIGYYAYRLKNKQRNSINRYSELHSLNLDVMFKLMPSQTL